MEEDKRHLDIAPFKSWLIALVPQGCLCLGLLAGTLPARLEHMKQTLGYKVPAP